MKNIHLSWIRPTTRQPSGAALLGSEIGGYKLYHSTNNTTYVDTGIFISGDVLDYTVLNVAPGTHYYRVTCVDMIGSGQESVQSPGCVIVVPTTPDPPDRPTGLGGTIV